MAAQAGKELLLKVDSGSAVFIDMAGGRTVSMSLDRGTVDITNQGSANRARQLLAGAAVRSMSVSFSGVFVDDASEEDARGYFFADTHANYQVIIPDFGTFQGAFAITNITYEGEHDGEVRHSISLESADAYAFTAA